MKKLLILIALFFIFNYSDAQEKTDSLISRESALNVYFDCGSCDLQYFRENFTLINYVRDRKVADLQIIVSTMGNGGGGREYMFQFVGIGKFRHLKDTLKFNSKADDTDDEIRTQQLKLIKRGLVPFILKTSFADKVNVSYAQESKKLVEKDPWNNWVFRLGGDIYINGQQSYKSLNLWSSASASRITEEIKHETNLSISYSENKYRLYDNNDSLIYSADSYQQSSSFTHSTIWSLGEHWGSGIEVGAWNATYSNLDFGMLFRPAIEYNVFKYSDASRKQLRFAYSLAGIYRNYTDTTVYDKLQENLLEQKLEINFKYITNWGSVRTGFNWNNYMHDFSLYQIGMDMSMDIRLLKGLSLNLYGYFSMPRNQIGLVKTESTPEDVLLRQHELSTQYSYYTRIGLSYTFGSIYNNVVNPRLD